MSTGQSDRRNYYWSATIDGDVDVTEEEARRAHGLGPKDPIPDEAWEWCARQRIEKQGGPPVEYEYDLERIEVFSS